VIDRATGIINYRKETRKFAVGLYGRSYDNWLTESVMYKGRFEKAIRRYERKRLVRAVLTRLLGEGVSGRAPVQLIRYRPRQ
jgi:hypothetical protein